jgi:hypothetical protein
MGLSTRRKNSCEGRNSSSSGICGGWPGKMLIPWTLSTISRREAILEVDRDGQI